MSFIEIEGMQVQEDVILFLVLLISAVFKPRQIFGYTAYWTETSSTIMVWCL